jgi:hypothetical protein
MTFRGLPILKSLLALTIIAALSLGVALAKKTPVPASSAERHGLKFSHSQHVDEQAVACDKCHNAKASKDGWDDLLPTHKECAECHDVKEATGCKTCHLNANPTPGPRVTRYSPKFSHVRHLEQGKLECVSCHAKLDEPLANGKFGHLPGMNDCMACHSQKLVKNECATCHLPSDQLAPRDHKLNWIYRHGVEAKADRDTRCMTCHNVNQNVADQCERCHQGDAITSPHPRNYIARHGQEAHQSDLQCSACHEQREFCNSCHRQNNMVPPDHMKPNWAVRGTGGEHTSQAGFDLESCMSCHDVPGQDPVCVQCHGK